MKQILPILTLTTLSAAAFADAGAAAPAAAASGLVYNRVTVQQNTSGETNRNISVANLINGSNVLVELSQNYQDLGNNTTGNGVVAIGYVFKNVTNGIDVTANITAGGDDGIGLNLRRSLSEVVAGLEIAIGYNHFEGSQNSWNYEVSYNINKQFSVAFGAQDVSGDNEKSIALRYNY